MENYIFSPVLDDSDKPAAGKTAMTTSSAQPFDIDLVIPHLLQAVRPFPKVAMFELADLDYCPPFEQLIACMISIRTYDEVSLLVAQRLFAQARRPAEMLRLTPDAIQQLACLSQHWLLSRRKVKRYCKRWVEAFPLDTLGDIFDYIFYNPDRIVILESQVITVATQAFDRLPLLAKFRLC